MMKNKRFHISFRPEKCAAAWVFLAGLLWNVSFVYGNNDAVRFSENVNLALRRTAHLLLVSNGDSTTQIPPVVQHGPVTFQVRLENMLQYAELPVILSEALKKQGIERGYNVMILNCRDSTIQLGYNFADVNSKDGVACGKRTQDLRCYTLQVTFLPENARTAGTEPNWLLLTAGGMMLAVGFIAWKKIRSKPQPRVTTHSGMRFGQSTFDPDNLTLNVAGTSHQLTFREAKLLRLFIAHPNKVLERQFILQSVWEDEGVTVGRSVDVFVSRLRKMFSTDPLLKIIAVHGVGYRFEVHS